MTGPKRGPEKGSERRSFGRLRRLPSGNYQASYFHADELHRAPSTYPRKRSAEAWLDEEQKLIDAGTWSSPTDREANERAGLAMTFQRYADQWLTARELKPRTRADYRSLLDRVILPELGSVPVQSITPVMIRGWYGNVGSDKPTQRARAYGLTRTILVTAVQDGLLAANPCHIRAGGSAKRVHQVKPATLDELAKLVEAMPDRYGAMILLAAWCGLRFGELAALRRCDVDLTNQKVKVRQGVTKIKGQFVVGTPKSDAGTRDVSIPPHLVPVIREHVADHAEWGRQGLLFPAAKGGYLSQSTLFKSYEKARGKAGRPDLRFHDLRHTGAVLAAQTGATLAELMGRLGHATPAAAMRYQHAAEDRDAEIARKLSLLAGGGQAAPVVSA